MIFQKIYSEFCRWKSETFKTDYVDILLLHRPDALMEPEEVAEAFEILEKSGKVKAFGVSNHNPMQIELLNQYCR